MELLKVIVNDFGGSPVAEHNYPCPVYSDKHAVYQISYGYFQPSWQAQKEGWRLVKADTWIKRLTLKYMFGDEQNGEVICTGVSKGIEGVDEQKESGDEIVL